MRTAGLVGVFQANDWWGCNPVLFFTNTGTSWHSNNGHLPRKRMWKKGLLFHSASASGTRCPGLKEDFKMRYRRFQEVLLGDGPSLLWLVCKWGKLFIVFVYNLIFCYTVVRLNIYIYIYIYIYEFKYIYIYNIHRTLASQKLCLAGLIKQANPPRQIIGLVKQDTHRYYQAPHRNCMSLPRSAT